MKSALNWQEATVIALREVTPTVREFTLLPPEGAQPHEPGSHLQVQIGVASTATSGTGLRLHTRSYSLIGLPNAQPNHQAAKPAKPANPGYRIAVKRLDDGRGGSLAMWRLAVGDRLRITPPQNHFPLDLMAPAYLLVAGGIGITPLLGMAQALAARGASVRLCFGARSDDELAYWPDLQAALGTNAQAALASRGEMIPLAKEIASLPVGAQMYVCGPVPLLDAARRTWAQAGRPLSGLRYETFGSSGRFAPQAFNVKVPRHQLAFAVPQDAGLLDCLEREGIQALYDCRRGECGLCAMDVLSLQGEIDHRDVFLSDDEKSSNKRICVCVSRVVASMDGAAGGVGEITLDSAYRPEASSVG